MSNELTPQNHTDCGEIVSIIERERANTFRIDNREVISMYWGIGEELTRERDLDRRYCAEKVATKKAPEQAGRVAILQGTSYEIRPEGNEVQKIAC